VTRITRRVVVSRRRSGCAVSMQGSGGTWLPNPSGESPFDGAAAARFGARWNSPGRSVIYTTGSYAGALLEILVHAQRPMLRVPYHCLVIDVAVEMEIVTLSPAELPGWDAPDYTASRAAGDAWLDANRSALLQVPTMTGYPYESNVLINLRHPDVRHLRLDGPHLVEWDERLLDVQ
jgi:RES domain-containing protein